MRIFGELAASGLFFLGIFAVASAILLLLGISGIFITIVSPSTQEGLSRKG